MVGFCLFLLFVLLFVFLVDLFLFLFLQCPFLHGDDVLCWLLSCPLSSVCFPENVLGLIWCGSVYLVTTTGFVADQLR